MWFLTGSQHLYGPQVLQQVADGSRQIVGALNESESISAPIVLKPVLTEAAAIRRMMIEASADAGREVAA